MLAYMSDKLEGESADVRALNSVLSVLAALAKDENSTW
jgi:hypothetical protein